MSTKGSKKKHSLADKYPQHVGWTDTKEMKAKIIQYGYDKDMTLSPTMRFIVREYFKMIEAQGEG